MFRFFYGVPTPQTRNVFRYLARKRVVLQQLVRHDGGEVLQRDGGQQHGHGPPFTRLVGAFARQGRNDVRSGITLPVDQAVQRFVFAGVHRLLLDEPANLLDQFPFGGTAEMAYGIDEQFLAVGKSQREGIHHSRTDRVAAKPVMDGVLRWSEVQIPQGNLQAGRCVGRTHDRDSSNPAPAPGRVMKLRNLVACCEKAVR